ncbi:Fez family zinc finger protein 2, partial [Stylophora pistillata]
EPGNPVQPVSREATNTRQFSHGNISTMARLPLSIKPPFDPSQGTSSVITQPGQPASLATPLTLAISPESDTRNSANHRENDSGSLLLARRRDGTYFPSHSSILSISRRKKTARKSVFQRKVSPTSSPNPMLHRKAMHGEVIYSTNLLSRKNREGFDAAANESMNHPEAVDSPGLCDSTENGNYRPSLHGTGEEMETESNHRDIYSSDTVAAFSVEDSAGFPNFPNLESSSTNGSSPAISDGHPAVIDIHSDSRETSGGENDSDSNFVSSENSPPQNHAAQMKSSHRNGQQGSHILDIDEAQSFHPKTAIVVLPNTIQVKTEPNEVLSMSNGHSPEPNTEERSQPHLRSSPERENRSLGPSVQNYTFSQQVLPTSSQDGLPNSAPVHSGPSLPQVVDVVGACPDQEDHTESSATHPPGGPYQDMKEYSCDICHKQFDSANSLLRHKRSHTGDRPYICKICGWGFNLSGNLNQHLAIHQKVKPFKCVYCGKTFARSNVLKAHVRCHTGERPFQCQLCGSKFIIGHNLKKHMVTRHGVKEDDRIFSQNDAPEDNGRSHSSVFSQNSTSEINGRYQRSDNSENVSIPKSQS